MLQRCLSSNQLFQFRHLHFLLSLLFRLYIEPPDLLLQMNIDLRKLLAATIAISFFSSQFLIEFIKLPENKEVRLFQIHLIV